MNLVKSLMMLVCFSSFSAWAAMDAQSHLTEARAGYAARDQFDAAKGGYYSVVNSIEHAQEVIKDSAADAKMKIEANLIAGRGIYWIGVHSSDKQIKLDKFKGAMDFANAAKALDNTIADSYYYYGLALGRWAETNGIVDSLGRKQELMDSMTATQARKDINGEPGGKIDGYGPARVSGRIYYKLPFFAGGSREKALQLLGVAYKQAPQNFLNGIYLAETLADGGSDAEKAQACEILKGITAKKPVDGIADRAPENKEDIAEAVRLFSSICK